MPSAVIEKSAYDPATRTMSVWFRTSGRRYDYEGVSPEIYAAYRASFSKGRYFNRFIRDRFQHRRIADSQ
jgi:hypothetical protein